MLINFIYTTYPDVCSLETARLVQVQRLLGARLGHDLFMYSITIDPEHDTPAVLAQYRARFQIGPGWLFLTGRRADIDVLRTRLGAPPAAAQDQERHSRSLLLGNVTTWRWMKRSPMENPYFIATQLAEWLPNWKVPTVHPSYAQAFPLTSLAQGEYLFHRRCAAWHSLGQGNGVGPDLAGVTQQRERAWLERWLKEPEKMLAEGDPIALALRTRYKEVAMPNLHLSTSNVAALLAYLETHRPATVPR